MTDPTLIADLIRAGLDPDLVARVTVALVEASVRRHSADVPVDIAAEKRRAADRERKRNLRNSADNPQTPQISADIHTTISKEDKILSKVERAKRISADWILSDIDQKFALDRGMLAARIQSEAEKFKNYWTAKSGQTATSPNWSAKWRTWAQNAIERSGIAAPAPAINGVPQREKTPWELYGISEAQWRLLPIDYDHNKQKYGDAREWLEKQKIRGNAGMVEAGHDEPPQLRFSS